MLLPEVGSRVARSKKIKKAKFGHKNFPKKAKSSKMKKGQIKTRVFFSKIR